MKYTGIAPFAGLDRTRFENQHITFKEHCEQEHNMWNYLYFVVHLRMKEKTELTGPESYVYDQIKGHIENRVKLNSMNNNIHFVQ